MMGYWQVGRGRQSQPVTCGQVVRAVYELDNQADQTSAWDDDGPVTVDVIYNGVLVTGLHPLSLRLAVRDIPTEAT